MCFAPQRRALFRPSKSGPNLMCFVHFELEMCFAPPRRTLLRHRSFQKWSEREVFLGFSLANVFRATTACTFSTSQLPKVVRTWGVFSFFTCKRASHHNGVHFFDISTSKNGPDLVCFVHFDFEMCFAPQRRAIFHLSSGQLAPHPPLWRAYFSTLGASNHWKKYSVSRLSYLFAHLPASSFFWDFIFFDLLSSSLLFSSLLFSSLLFSSLLFSSLLFSSLLSSLFFSSLLFSDSSHLCFSSVHIVGSLTSQLPSII